MAFILLSAIVPLMLAAGFCLVMAGSRFPRLHWKLAYWGLAAILSGVNILLIHFMELQVGAWGRSVSAARMQGLGLMHLLIVTGLVLLFLSAKRPKLADNEFFY